MNNDLYLHGLEYQFGDLVSIDTLLGVFGKERIKALKNKGLKQYSVANVAAFELARESIKKTLMSLSKHQVNSIDAVIYNSGTLSLENYSDKAISSILFDLGIKDCDIFLVGYQGCSGFSTILRLARNMLVSEELQNVLIVTADVIEPEYRIYLDGYAVLSDAAASCLISHDVSDLLLRGVWQHTNTQMGVLDPKENFVMYGMTMFNSIKKTIAQALDAESLAPNNINHLVMNNYNYEFTDFILYETGIPENCINHLRDNISLYGHAFSCDNIINLYAIKNKTLKGDIILTLDAGIVNWGSVILEAF